MNWVAYIAGWPLQCCRSDSDVTLVASRPMGVKFYEKLHYLLDSWVFTTLPDKNELIIEQAIQI